MSEIEEQVKKIVIDHLGIEESKVAPESKFMSRELENFSAPITSLVPASFISIELPESTIDQTETWVENGIEVKIVKETMGAALLDIESRHPAIAVAIKRKVVNSTVVRRMNPRGRLPVINHSLKWTPTASEEIKRLLSAAQ